MKIFAMQTEDVPQDWGTTQSVTKHKVNQPIHYFYVHPDYMVAKQGCMYEFDVWLNGSLLHKNKQPTIVESTETEKQLRWQYTHTFAEEQENEQVISFIASKECTNQPKEFVVGCQSIQLEP